MSTGVGRRLAAVAAAVLGMGFLGTGSASAVPLLPPGVIDTYPGWDYLDPVNIAEARVYARLWFEFKDTGVVSPEFAAFRMYSTTESFVTPLDGDLVLGSSSRTTEEQCARV